LLGTKNTLRKDSLSIPINADKDTLFVFENEKPGKHSFTVISGAKGSYGDYLFKIQQVWLPSYLNIAPAQNTTGLPYKMAQRLKLNIYDRTGELVTSIEINIPGKSTFFYPTRWVH
jgi:hypothetical protein